ncbi:MAG: hypothetical protein Q9227_003720 [Pyrenula ochraceoflavens]
MEKYIYLLIVVCASSSAAQRTNRTDLPKQTYRLLTEDENLGMAGGLIRDLSLLAERQDQSLGYCEALFTQSNAVRSRQSSLQSATTEDGAPLSILFTLCRARYTDVSEECLSPERYAYLLDKEQKVESLMQFFEHADADQSFWNNTYIQTIRSIVDAKTSQKCVAAPPPPSSKSGLGVLNDVFQVAKSCTTLVAQTYKFMKFTLGKNSSLGKFCGKILGVASGVVAATQILNGVLLVLREDQSSDWLWNLTGRATPVPQGEPWALNIKVQTRGQLPHDAPKPDTIPVTQFEGDDIPSDYASKWLKSSGRCGSNKNIRTIRSKTLTRFSKRDDQYDERALPTSYADLESIVANLIRAVFLPEVAKTGQLAASYSLYDEGYGGAYDIDNGGSLWMDLWLTKEPDLAQLNSPPHKSLPSWKYQAEKSSDKVSGQECFDVYVPDGVPTKDPGFDGTPSKHWTFAFADACKQAIGATGLGMPKDFTYSGPGYNSNVGNKGGSDAPDPQNGVGFSGTYHADGCESQIECTDIVGKNGDGSSGDLKNHFDTCKSLTRDEIYHGGMFHHMKGGLAWNSPCGWFEIHPLGDQGSA